MAGVAEAKHAVTESPEAVVHQQAGRITIAIVFAVVILLGGLLPIFAGDVDGGTLALIVATCAICLIGILRSAVRGFRPAAAVFFIFSLCWLGVAPLAQIAQGQAAWVDWSIVRDVPRVQFSLILGVLMLTFFLLGTHLGEVLLPRRPAVRRPLVGTPLLVALATVLVLITPVVIQLQGGLGILFSDRLSRTENLTAAGLDTSSGGGAGGGLTVLLPMALALAVSHLGIRAVRDARKLQPGRFPRVAFICALCGIAGLVLFANPLSSTRFISAVAFGSVTLAIFRPRSRVAGSILAVLGLLVVLFVYPSLSQTSGAQQYEGLARLGFALSSPDFDGFQQMVNTVKYAEHAGLSWGHTIAGAVLFFVPRSIWVDKAMPATFEVSAHAGYSFLNLSLPYHAELFLNFGVVGVIVGSLLLGALAGALDEAWAEHPSSTWAVFTPVIGLSLLAVLRGPMGSLTPTYLPVIGIMLVAVLAQRWIMPRLVDWLLNRGS